MSEELRLKLIARVAKLYWYKDSIEDFANSIAFTESVEEIINLLEKGE